MTFLLFTYIQPSPSLSPLMWQTMLRAPDRQTEWATMPQHTYHRSEWTIQGTSQAFKMMASACFEKITFFLELWIIYFLCTGKFKEVCLFFSRNSTSREGLCQDTTVIKYVKGMEIWSRVVCFCCGLLKVWPYAIICLLIHVNCRDQNENH